MTDEPLTAEEPLQIVAVLMPFNPKTSADNGKRLSATTISETNRKGIPDE